MERESRRALAGCFVLVSMAVGIEGHLQQIVSYLGIDLWGDGDMDHEHPGLVVGFRF